MSVMPTGAKVTTYGIDADCDVKALSLTPTGLGTPLRLQRPGHGLYCWGLEHPAMTGMQPLGYQRPDPMKAVHLPLAGRHNVMNALAAIAVAAREVYPLVFGKEGGWPWMEPLLGLWSTLP